MESDNLEAVRYQARELTQLEAVTMAMEHAQSRGLAGHPQAFLDGLPWGWSVVNTNAISTLAGTLMDALEGGLDQAEQDAAAGARLFREAAGQDDQDDPLCECGVTLGGHYADDDGWLTRCPGGPHEHEWTDCTTIGDAITGRKRRLCTVPGCGVQSLGGDLVDPWAELPEQALVPEQRDDVDRRWRPGNRRTGGSTLGPSA